jgi:hypothetical protein
MQESLLDIIRPITLLSGTHSDTAKTGSGCFMNVVAYLNGEAQITDKSPCVCRSIRRVAIWFNDFLEDDERFRLLPYVQRAMGTESRDEQVKLHRLEVLVVLVTDLLAMAGPTKAASIAFLTREALARSTGCTSDLDYFAGLATSAAGAALGNGISRTTLITRMLAFMEQICPAADAPSLVLIERANRLLEAAAAK